MSTTAFNPRQRLTIQQARRLARSIQSPDDVAARVADMRAREDAARLVDRHDYGTDALPLSRTPARRPSAWFAPMAFVAVLALVAMGYVLAVVPR